MNRLRTARINMGLTQQQMADYLEYPLREYRKNERAGEKFLKKHPHIWDYINLRLLVCGVTLDEKDHWDRDSIIKLFMSYGSTQEEFARLLGTSKSTVTRLLHHGQRPGLRIRRRLNQLDKQRKEAFF